MLNGKGFFIWQVSRAEAGNVTAIVNKAVAANLKHVLIKIADGVSSFNISSTGADLVAPLVSALKARGIEVWGWHYVYGFDPVGEASKAYQRIQQTGVDGYVIDAEAEYKQPGKASAARSFMQALRSALPFFPIGLSTYRYPSIHTDLPWQEFLSRCDYAMPQVYWIGRHDPRAQLARTISEYRALTALPIIPAGPAWTEGGWAPTTADLVDFMNTAREYNLGGVNYWEWYHASNLPSLWNTIAAYQWPDAAEPPATPAPIGRGRVNVAILNVRSGPSTSFAKVGSVKLGTRVTIFQVSQDWAKISPNSELWVSQLYLDPI